jgi:hypothetical protein
LADFAAFAAAGPTRGVDVAVTAVDLLVARFPALDCFPALFWADLGAVSWTLSGVPFVGDPPAALTVPFLVGPLPVVEVGA